MALNFGMMQPANISGQMLAGQQQAQQNQLAQQQLKQSEMQTQQSTMQMEQMQRDRDALGKLQAQFVANGQSPDLEANADAMMASGIQHYVDVGMQIKQKLQQQKQFAEIMGSGTSAPAMPANALAPPNTGGAANVMDLQRKRNQLLSMGTPQGIAAAKALDADIALVSKEPVYHNVSGVGLVDPRTGKVVTPSVESTPPEIKQYEYAKAQGYKGSLFDFKREMAQAGRAPAQPRPEQPPVAVVDPVTGKQVFVTREEALRDRMTPAASMESLPPKEIQKREAAFPQATSSMKGFDAKSDSFIKDLEKLRDDPGLNQITGSVYGRTPSLSREGSRAQSQYNKVFAKGGFQALQDMRDASKTGGALGNVSNQEGERLERSIVGGLDRTQNVEDVKAGITELIDSIKGSKARMKEAYDMTYDYKQSNTPSVSSPATPPATTKAGATVSNW